MPPRDCDCAVFELIAEIKVGIEQVQMAFEVLPDRGTNGVYDTNCQHRRDEQDGVFFLLH